MPFRSTASRELVQASGIILLWSAIFLLSKLVLTGLQIKSFAPAFMACSVFDTCWLSVQTSNGTELYRAEARRA